MVGSTSEIMEPGQNIDLPNADIKVEDVPLSIMLNTDIDPITNANTVKIPTGEMHFLVPNVVVKSKVEEHSEDESNSLESFIIIEEAVEEVTTTYDEHILEICHEDDAMNCLDQYEDIGYESLSSPEYDYKTSISTALILTDLLSKK